MCTLKSFIVLVIFVQFSHQICNNNNSLHDINCWAVTSPQDINITSDFCENQHLPLNYGVILRINNSNIPTLNPDYFKNFVGCQIVNLNIHNSGVKYISPFTFNVFERLDVINLANNKIKILKNGIFNETQQSENYISRWKISTLMIENNGLELIEDKALDNLQNLQFLKLKNNSLSTIPSITKWSSLHELDLSNNYFKDINIKHVNLLKLRINENKLTNFHFSAEETPKLRELHLSFNNISQLTATDNSFGQILWLNISHNFIRNYNVSENMRLLDWSYNNLGHVSKNMFRKAKVLDYLNLSGNKIRILSCDVFQYSNLGSLNLSNNNLFSLPPLIFANNSLLLLDISNNQLESNVANSILHLQKMKYLFLHNNNIDHIFINQLPPNLKLISIFGNKFKSCEKLCKIVNELKLKNIEIEFEYRLYEEEINGDICKCYNVTNEYLAYVLKNLTIENRKDYQNLNDNLNRIDINGKMNLLNGISLMLKFVLGFLIVIILLFTVIHRRSILSCGLREDKSLEQGQQLRSFVNE